MLKYAVLAIGASLLLLLAACGGDDTATVASRSVNASASASAGTSRTPAKTATAKPSPSASSTPAATASPAPEDPLAVAVRLTGALPPSQCPSSIPAGAECIDWQSPSAQATAERGIAVFGVYSDGGAGYILGRDQAGHWQFWQVTQNPYHLLGLPGQFQACTSGDVLNVREGPSTDSPVATALPDLTVMTAEEFVLTEPGDPAGQGFSAFGQGWYRISAPASGWVYSKYTEHLSPTPETACSFHKTSLQ